MKTLALSLLASVAALALFAGSATAASLPFRTGTYKGVTSQCGTPEKAHPCYAFGFRVAVHNQCRVGRTYRRALCFIKLHARPSVDLRCSDGTYRHALPFNSIFKAMPRSGNFFNGFGPTTDREEIGFRITGTVARGYLKVSDSFSRTGGPADIFCNTGRVTFTLRRTGP
jgi:hypothetical protein